MLATVDRAFRERIKWKCRRGLLELDLVLESFLQKQGDRLGAEDWAQFSALLDLPDNDLWDLVCARRDAVSPDQEKVVVLLRGS